MNKTQTSISPSNHAPNSGSSWGGSQLLPQSCTTPQMGQQRPHYLHEYTPQSLPQAHQQMLAQQTYESQYPKQLSSSQSPRLRNIQNECRMKQPPSTAPQGNGMTPRQAMAKRMKETTTTKASQQQSGHNHPHKHNSETISSSITNKFQFGRRLVGTGQGARRIAGLGSLKDGSSGLSTNNQKRTSTQPACPKSRRSVIESATTSVTPRQQQWANPFVIQNMRLCEKFETPFETEEFLANIVKLQNTINPTKQKKSLKPDVNIEQSFASTIQQRSGFRSLETIGPQHDDSAQSPKFNNLKLDQSNQDQYRNLLQLAQTATVSNNSSIEHVVIHGFGSNLPAERIEAVEVQSSTGDKTVVERVPNLQHYRAQTQDIPRKPEPRVPPIHLAQLHQINKYASCNEPPQLTIPNQLKSFQQSARESYSIRNPHKDGKVEVINSASAAFRNFVKEKTLYLKGLDPFQAIRAQTNSSDAWQKLQLQNVPKKAMINKVRHSQKPFNTVNVSVAAPKTQRSKDATKKTRRKIDIKSYSPRGSDMNEERRSNLSKPVLSTKKLDDQFKGMRQDSIEQKAVDPTLTLSTATLFNDRNNANTSQVNQTTGRLSIVQPRKTQHNQSLCVATEQANNNDCSTVKADETKDGLSQAEANQVSPQKTFASKKMSTQDELKQNSFMQSSCKDEGSEIPDGLHKMPSVSPTFKQLSEIFAFMDRQDFEETANMQSNNLHSFEPAPLIQVQMTERSVHPQKVEVRKRRKTRAGTLPYQLVNRFENSKLGMTKQEELKNKDSARKYANQTQQQQQQNAAVNTSQTRKSQQAAKPAVVGDPNNLSNRFFSLRRQRERRHEAILQKQRGNQQEMYSNQQQWVKLNQTTTPRPSASPNMINKPAMMTQQLYNDKVLNKDFVSMMGKNSPFTRKPQNSSVTQRNNQKARQSTQQKTSFGQETFSRGGETQLGETADIPINQRNSTKQFGSELKSLIQTSLMEQNQGGIKVSNMMNNSLMKDKYKSSSGINSSTGSQAPVYEEIISFNQSCMASDTQEIGDMLETLNPTTEEKVHKGSQSLMDADNDQFSVPYSGFIDNCNLIQFDPKVKITGVNLDQTTSIDGVSTHQKLFLAQPGGPQQPIGNLYYQMQNNSSRHPNQQALTPSQLLAYIKDQQAKTAKGAGHYPGSSIFSQHQQPLIVQQEANRRQREFARVAKDGRIAYIVCPPRDRKSSTPQSRQGHVGSAPNDDIEESSMQLQISKPWKTKQEQLAVIDQTIAEMRDKHQKTEQKNWQLIVHQQQAGQNAVDGQELIKISPPAGLVQPDTERAVTPPSPYSQYKPNKRNMIIKPLLSGDGRQSPRMWQHQTQPANKQTPGAAVFSDNLYLPHFAMQQQDSFDRQDTENDPQNTVTANSLSPASSPKNGENSNSKQEQPLKRLEMSLQWPESILPASTPTNQNYLKVKVPVLSINQFDPALRDSNESRNNNSMKQPGYKSQGQTNLQVKPSSPPSSTFMPEKRKKIKLASKHNNTGGDRQEEAVSQRTSPKTNIMLGSYRLKDQKLGSEENSTIGEVPSSNNFNQMSHLQHGAAREGYYTTRTAAEDPQNLDVMNKMVAEVGRQDTLQFFNTAAQQQVQHPFAQTAGTAVGQAATMQSNCHSQETSVEEEQSEEIDPGEFTYSKLIIRDQNGCGKSPMIKELKYVPVCDKSMKKRRLSKALNEEWARLASSHEKTTQQHQQHLLKSQHQASTSPTGTTIHVHPMNYSHITKPSSAGGVTENITASFNAYAFPLPESSGSREMACMINEDMIAIEEMSQEQQRSNMTTIWTKPNSQNASVSRPSADGSKVSTSRGADESYALRRLSKNSNMVILQNQHNQTYSSKLQMQDVLRGSNNMTNISAKQPVLGGQRSPRDMVIESGPTALTVFKVPYPAKSQLTVKFNANGETIHGLMQHLKGGQGDADSSSHRQYVYQQLQQLNSQGPMTPRETTELLLMVSGNQNAAAFQHESRPPSHVSCGNNPRQSEMRQDGSSLVPKYDLKSNF